MREPREDGGHPITICSPTCRGRPSSGPGVSVVNALSKRLDVEVVRDGWRHRQSYERGLPTGPLERVGKAKGHGSTVSFWPDPDIFAAGFSFVDRAGRSATTQPHQR